MCLKRSVFEKLKDKYDLAYKTVEGEIHHSFFECRIKKVNGNKLPDWFGEDFEFSHKWVDMGGEIWCEPDIEFVHAGYKAWRCNLKEHINEGIPQTVN